MAKPELKPCPLCGRETKYRVFNNSFLHGWIGCPECQLYINWTRSAREAVERWNRRANT